MTTSIHQDLVLKYFGQLTGDNDTDLRLSVHIADYKKALAKVDDIRKDINSSDYAKKSQSEKILLDAQAVFKKGVSELLQPVLSRPIDAHRAIAQELMPESSNSDIRELARSIRQADDRAALRTMKIEDASKLLRVDAAAGKRRVLDAVEGDLHLSRVLGVDAAKSLFLSAAKPNLIKEASEAEAAAASSKMIEQALPAAVSLIAREKGLDIDQVLQSQKTERINSMSAKEKAKIISENGKDAYIKMMNGE